MTTFVTPQRPEKGQTVRVAGLRGQWRVTGYAADGSVWVFGGPVLRARARAVRAERLRAAR